MPKITLPQVGKSSGPVTVLRWLKKPSQAVAKDVPLLHIETDDGAAEVACPMDGVLVEILAPAGKTVAVGATLAEISATSAASPSTTPAPASTQNKPVSQQEPKMSASKPSGPVVPVVMPKAGQSMEEGTLVKWHVKVGDTIKKGQIIFEIETDKATMEVEATDAGKIAKIVLDEGGTIKVLEPVAFLAESAGDVDAYIATHGNGESASGGGGAGAATASAPVSAAVSSVPASTTDTGRVKASPAARKIAEEKGVDLSRVPTGSGPGGRILSTDVLSAGASAAAAPAKAAPAVAIPAFVAPPATGEGLTRKKMSAMRKAIARNLLASKQTIPHFYVKLTIEAGSLYNFYQGEKAKYPVSLNDVVVAACAKAIMEFPAFRSRLEGDEIVTFPSANIGLAVGMDDGLVVPVMMSADQRTLGQIGAESKRLAVNARGGKIEGMGSGVFTITNLGMFGTEEFSGIINPPEAAILAVGAVREEVICSGGTLRPGRVMTMTLSADHRIIDGMLAAKFMARLKEILEYPQQLA